MTLIVINVLMFGVEWLGSQTQASWWPDFAQNIVLMPVSVIAEPWTLFTSGFAHDWSSPLHLAVNMYSLYIFGQGVEPLLGKGRYLALYMLSLFAGALGVLWLGDPTGITVGASGAIFGLMGAYLIFLRSLGQPSGQMFFLIAINLAFGFFSSGISWEGHVGGLIGGITVAAIYSQTRRPQDQNMQKVALAALSILMIGLAVVRVMALS
jgi:membrane associated rhomboid family serine protease